MKFQIAYGKSLFLLFSLIILTACGGGGGGDTGNTPPPNNPIPPASVVQLSAGGSYNCARFSDGRVKCWGDGGAALGAEKGLTVDEERIGDHPDDMGDNLATISLGSGVTIEQIVSSQHFSCARLSDGSIKCWGWNLHSQLDQPSGSILGDEPGEMGDALTAIDLGSGILAQDLAAGANHVCALINNNEVKCWGGNQFGQLGLGDANDRGDDPNEMGDSLPTVNLGTNFSVSRIVAGEFHTCALSDSGVKCWGMNDRGQLGLGDTLNRGGLPNHMGDNLPMLSFGSGLSVMQISSGDDHTCVTLYDGGNNPFTLPVKCWGDNTYGQLGLGDTNHRGDNANEMGGNLPFLDLGNGRTATNLIIGNLHSCALLDNGRSKCWGNNISGQLGLGDTNNRGDNANEMGTNLPSLVLDSGLTGGVSATGGNRTCGYVSGGIKCWGRNTSGFLGVGDTLHRGDNVNEMGDNLAFINLGTGTGSVTRISMSLTHTCVVLDNSELKCWGANDYGQLGLENGHLPGDEPGDMGQHLPYINLGTGRTAQSISTGLNHACALLDNGTVKCWGENNFGQLGLEDNQHRGDSINDMGDNLPAINLGTGRTVIQIAAGRLHNCALLDNGSVKCWGYNASGQLGLGNTERLGSQANEMGDNLPVVDLGNGRTATQISLGDDYACALLDNEAVKCWGANFYGQLGLGDTTARGDNPNEMGVNLPVVDLGSGRRAVRLASKAEHTCAILDNGELKCWGQNFSGQLGLGDTSHRGDNANEMGDNLMAVDLGVGLNVTQLATGYYHSCALLDNNEAKCWGQGNNGALGSGNRSRLGDNADEMGNNLPVVNLGTGRTAQQISAGYDHTCALLDNDQVKCWGHNQHGILGLGHTEALGNDPDEMGDNLPAVNLRN